MCGIIPCVQGSFSVTISVTACPLRVQVRWAFDPGELNPFTWLWAPGQQPSQELSELERVYWIEYVRKGHEAATEAVRVRGRALGLQPPDRLTYPHLSYESPPSYVAYRCDLPGVLPSLQGFHRLWRTLQAGLRRGGPDPLGPFREKVAALAPQMGLLRAGALRGDRLLSWGKVDGLRYDGEDSLWGWIQATTHTRFWSEALAYLQAGGREVWEFLETIGKWAAGPVNGKVWQKVLSQLRASPEGERWSLVDPFWPVGPAIELLSFSRKGRIVERRVREYLYARGREGVVPPSPSLSQESTGGYIGAYHLALLSLARYGSRKAVCAWCGQAFFRERRSARYCSGRCRMAALRARRKG